MEIQDIKKEMLAFKDFFGGDLLYIDDVKSAKNKGELRQIIDKQSEHLEMQLSDALRHLDRFTERLFIIKDQQP